MYLLTRNNVPHFAFYKKLTELCRSEGLGYSKFSKHFAKHEYYRDDEVEIFKGEPK